ncbi:Gibberellin 2-beta-dioxygenase 8 [Vitis vinifera]|uniref:gibberellin 2beta-dioxygenase n=1 Tax=Vitis vinifera TaxID=29760 RepID=A0A438EJ55_VITVI|nr:Gibberellin 2-beta-dioxygenase 8 [Vitis vinifera]RVX11484.1 Gibberellin 2-beta-dioxygenase 8 [Vitis vinifera]
MTNSNPPLLQHYGVLCQHGETPAVQQRDCGNNGAAMEECQLPLIDLEGLWSESEEERLACASAIGRASSKWGFFQVVNHGIRPELLSEMRREQVKLFETPFERKAACQLLDNSYRWGTPTATRLKELSWSEAFHIPLTKVSEEACYGEFCSLREVMQEFAKAMSNLARLLAGVLAESLGHQKGVFDEICDESTCFLRLNRYPPCPVSPEVFGLVPHTDSDFLTILYQDEVGGLQLMKDSKWVAVKPNKDTLIVNIGDLFQAWSNNEYKSVEHQVMANAIKERYSIAYFLCPSYDAFIGSCSEPTIYRKFTFGEYRQQVQEDVKKTGHKVGLPRFLLQTTQ